MKKKYADLVTENEKLLSDYRAAITTTPSETKSNALDEIEQNLAALKARTEQTAYKPATSLTINNSMLIGETVEFQKSPNSSGKFKSGYADAIVFHFTSSLSLESSVAALTNPEMKASAHVIIGRDGKIVQLVPFDRIAWHAGRSQYKGRSGYNNYAIGIELVNAGRLVKEGETYRAWFGKTYDESEVKPAVGRNEKDSTYWHKFSEIQINRAKEIATLLTETYNIKEILGNDEIAPGRKIDPGPLFPLEKIREKLLAKT